MRSRMPPVSGMWWRGSVVCPLQRTSPYSSKSGRYPPPRPCVKITEVSRISSKQSCSWLHKRPFERPCRSYCSKTCSTMEDACGIDIAEIHSENWAVSVHLSARDLCAIWRVFCLPSQPNQSAASFMRRDMRSTLVSRSAHGVPSACTFPCFHQPPAVLNVMANLSAHHWLAAWWWQ